MSTHWKKYIHNLRRREIESIFSKYPEKSFGRALELGAGDGFQSRLLINYVDHLICTELDEKRLLKSETPGIDYHICDAERIGESFRENHFDLVYSSNLFEHLPNPEAALRGIHKLLKQDGLSIHIMPSPFWALCHVVFHYPAVCIGVLRKLIRRELRVSSQPKENSDYTDNNLKLGHRSKGKLMRVLFPRPHGVSATLTKEFFVFSKRRWIREFENESFEVVSVLKGPVSSGYGFGLDNIRVACEKIGLTGEYIYIARKKCVNAKKHW